ncbi:MAG: hypothetical protein Q9190_000686 [Brigantiaea leucoxantha]
MHLFHLPLEIQFLILGQADLRRSVNNLLVSKEWYARAHPIYLAAPLGLTGRLNLSSHDLKRLPPPGSLLMDRIKDATEYLAIGLTRPPSTEALPITWFDFTDSELDELYEEFERPRIQVDTIGDWIKRIDSGLGVLAEALPAFPALKELHLQVSMMTEADPEKLPYPCYSASTLDKLLANLPWTLENLSLDTARAHLVPKDWQSCMPHICRTLARQIPRLKKVRLRMHCLCPDLFAPTDVQNAPTRIESLVVKLSMPYDQTRKKDDARLCESCQSNCDKSLLNEMVAAAKTPATEWKSLRMMRISYRHGIKLEAIDCLTCSQMIDPRVHFFHEDEGDFWDPWEESDLLRAYPSRFQPESW